MSELRPLPSGSVISFCGDEAVVVQDNGGNAITVEIDGRIEEWLWYLDGDTCQIISVSRPTFQMKILDERLGTKWPLPDYAKPGDAGIDLRACSIDGETWNAEYLDAELEPDGCMLIGTGVAIHIADPGYVGLIVPRSGLGHKHGLILGNGTGVIDSSFTGEIKVSLWNRSDTSYTISPGERIAQLLFVPIAQVAFNVVSDFAVTERGDSSFGSSGKV